MSQSSDEIFMTIKKQTSLRAKIQIELSEETHVMIVPIAIYILIFFLLTIKVT